MSDDTRLKIVLLITQHQQLCVCDLTAALSLSQPKVSRHLAQLRDSQLLIGEREGKWVHYRLNPTLPAWIKTIIEQSLTHNESYLAQCQLPQPVRSAC